MYIFKDTDLKLAILEDRHAEALYQLTDDSRAYLREWLPFIDFTTSVDQTRVFIQSGLKQFESGNGFHLGIWHHNKLAGVIGLHYINWPNRSTSIGYWLGESFQGKGLMTKACEQLITYCFDELQLNRIEIRVATENTKSQAIPKRLRFTKEGVLRNNEWINDRYVDHIVYSLLKEEW